MVDYYWKQVGKCLRHSCYCAFEFSRTELQFASVHSSLITVRYNRSQQRGSSLSLTLSSVKLAVQAGQLSHYFKFLVKNFLCHFSRHRSQVLIHESELVLANLCPKFLGTACSVGSEPPANIQLAWTAQLGSTYMPRSQMYAFSHRFFECLEKTMALSCWGHKNLSDSFPWAFQRTSLMLFSIFY